MPELAEVEVARLNVARWWEGRAAEEVVVHDANVAKGEGGVEALEHALALEARSIERRGKHLIARMEGDIALMFHFRMTGKIVSGQGVEPRFARLAFKDQRRLGEVRVFAPGEVDAYEPIAQMGPEPYDVDVDEFFALVSTSRRRLKDLLLDQRVIAGVGNIAISELFWRVGLAPEVRGKEVDREAFEALVDEMPRYFDWLIEGQMADEIVYLGESGAGQADNPFDVYGREGEACRSCEAGVVERVVFGGRSTYFCPSCQPVK